jgi:hypothetical protein
MFSWMIDFILSGLPGWLWPAISLGGFAVYSFAAVIGHFPAFKSYTIFIKPVGILACLGGIFMWGGAGVTAMYEEKIRDIKEKIAIATEQSKTANSKIETKIVVQKQIIHDTKVVIQKELVESAAKIDAECKLDPSVPTILNKAAKNPVGTVTVEVQK